MAIPKAETATEQQRLCLELIKKFKNIEDVEPAIKTAVAAVKQAQQRRGNAKSPPAKKETDDGDSDSR